MKWSVVEKSPVNKMLLLLQEISPFRLTAPVEMTGREIKKQ